MDIQTLFRANYTVNESCEFSSSEKNVLYFPPQEAVKGKLYETAFLFKYLDTLPWHGVFAARSKREAKTILASTMPDPESCCVSCFGTGYIVNVARPFQWDEVRLYPVLQNLPILDHEILLLSSFTRIEAYGKAGRIWRSERLASDQLKMEGYENGLVRCSAWDAPENRVVFIEVAVESGRIQSISSAGG